MSVGKKLVTSGFASDLVDLVIRRVCAQPQRSIFAAYLAWKGLNIPLEDRLLVLWSFDGGSLMDLGFRCGTVVSACNPVSKTKSLLQAPSTPMHFDVPSLWSLLFLDSGAQLHIKGEVAGDLEQLDDGRVRYN